MYLNKLEILGFKSFANKTNVVLDDGITAIVGPNGCGKTNIVDALRWALGEQRYSTLRSDKMEDVIFNGSKMRKPIGMAEVSLTIENNKGILPIEYNEVTITRRVYRSGESDYLLNKTVCRLKDIVSLFMDTGMGSNAYSVIELKMVETILSDKVDERRRLFEEAAGVTKYKARRKETFRRLTEVEADLIRVDDIISEVTKAVNSLNRQAKKAERYNEYIDRLRLLEVDVLQRDFTILLQRLIPFQEKHSSALVECDNISKHLEHEEALLQEHRNEEREIEHLLDVSRGAVSSILSSISEQEQTLLVNQERESSLRQSVIRLTAAKENYTRRLAETSQSRLEAETQLESLENDLILVDENAEMKRASHRSLEAVVANKKFENQGRQVRRMQLVQEISRLQSDSEKYKERIAAIDSRNASLLKEEDDAKELLGNLNQRLAEEDKGQLVLSDTVLAAEREFHDMEERKKTLRSEIDQLQNRAFEIQGQIGEKMTRIDFLSGLVDRLEGYSESVQHLLRNRDWSTSRYETIADAVNTRDDLRIAIEAALGDAAHYILVNDLHEAISGLQNLKNHKKGKATFACLSRIPEYKAVPFPIAGDGVIGWASELVRYAPKYHPLFQFLLRNVLVVRDEHIAHASTRTYPQIICATLGGDIFNGEGFVRGGSHGQEEGGLIGKKDQIAQLNQDVEKLKLLLVENQRILEEKNFDYSDIDLRKYAEKMKQTQQDLSVNERSIAQMMFEIERLERLIQKNSAERDTLQPEREELADRDADLLPKIEELLVIQCSVEEETEREGEALETLEAEFNLSNEELNNVNIALAEKRGVIQNLHHEVERLGKTRTDILESLESADIEIASAAETADSIADDIVGLTTELEATRLEKNEADVRLHGIEATLETKRADAERLEYALHDERIKHSQTVASVHEIELKVTEIKQRIENLEQHALEEFELTLEAVDFGEEDVFDLGQAKEEIRDLRVKVKTLGLVNPLAFEEWKKEKERLDLLTTQRQDLIDSRATLNTTIEEINQTAQEKFFETFSKVRDNFTTIFKSLFDEGDEADLILEEGEDPLEAKIDIIAKPRGKRPHSIDMLSGGEKTLTAIALLFAIYLVKPSPFCILDEVDAPLDDANIDRFVKILRQFSDNTQFIVVTHNKRMMEASDTLYGVTMEEEGVSKLVAVNFNKDTVAKFAHA